MEGKRIRLHAITPEDTDQILAWRNSDEVKQFFIYQRDLTRDDHSKWLQRIERGEVVQFIIEIIDGNLPIGSVYLRDIDSNHHKAEFGIFIGQSDMKNCGYGTEATRLILDYARNELQIHRVYLRVLADNRRAISSYEKSGFVKEGILRDDVCLNGKYRDIVWMAIVDRTSEEVK